MKKLTQNLLIILVIGVGVLLVILQLVPYRRNHANPPVLAEPAWDSPRTRTLFMQTCGDCHSNETIWPWYNNIAPVSWMVYQHVEEGRSQFNVSAWGYQENEAEKAVELYIHGEMPPKSYLPAHPKARLSNVDRQALIDGMFATFGSELRDDKENDD
jgi:hypothetical protein